MPSVYHHVLIISHFTCSAQQMALSKCTHSIPTSTTALPRKIPGYCNQPIPFSNIVGVHEMCGSNRTLLHHKEHAPFVWSTPVSTTSGERAMRRCVAFCHPRIVVNELPHKFDSKCSNRRHRFVARASAEAPEVGLVPKEGQTGTCCANLWPIPLLGGYNWFLNVYDRSFASSTGAFVVNHDSDKDITIAFEKNCKPSTENGSKTHTSFRGVATGNINVLSALSALSYDGTRYQLRSFEKGGAEPFFARRNEVHLLAPSDSSEGLDDGPSHSWMDPAPTYSISARLPALEVRDLYPGAGAGPRAATSFEYFTMNLFPIFPFNKYSCFVCVWRQKSDTPPVAIDKRNAGIRLSFFDPLELPKEVQEKPEPVARFAVKEFVGAVTDAGIHELHSRMIETIEKSENMEVVSTTDFRIVVDNTPGTLSSKRRNELWVEVV